MSTATHALRLAALTGAAFLLTACGSSEPEPAASAEDTPQDQTAATNEVAPADQTLRAAGFEVAVWHSTDAGEGRLEIGRDGEALYAVTGERFELGGPSDSAQRVGLGEDITGDGTPNLIVELWTGGTACCVDYLVYDLGAQGPELLGRVSALTGGRFKDYDGDGYPEIRLHDGTFMGWNAGVGDSPAPPVVLRWDGLWFTAAPELMHAPPPTHQQLATWARRVEGGGEWDSAGPFAPPAQLWGVTLDLLYTGHSDLAGAFIDSAWRDDIEGRDAFVASVYAKLAESPYWAEITRAN